MLCFPFIFRGALDAGATRITEEMKLACVKAIAELAQAEQNDEVARAYAGQELSFGPDYIIPKPFDPRLIVQIAPAVAQAAVESGVASRPIEGHRGLPPEADGLRVPLRPTDASAVPAGQAGAKRVVYADGEDERVLRAVQTVIDEKLAEPILVGRPAVIEMRIKSSACAWFRARTSRSSTPRTTAASTKPGMATTSCAAAKA